MLQLVLYIVATTVLIAIGVGVRKLNMAFDISRASNNNPFMGIALLTVMFGAPIVGFVICYYIPSTIHTFVYSDQVRWPWQFSISGGIDLTGPVTELFGSINGLIGAWIGLVGYKLWLTGISFIMLGIFAYSIFHGAF